MCLRQLGKGDPLVSDAVWICWERQRRNRELASALGIPLHEFKHVGETRRRGVKYLRGLASTTRLLLEKRPRLIIAMNPSIVLAVFCVTIGRIFPPRVFIDAHNSGLCPLEGRNRVLNFLARYVMRHADLTIVTNEGLRELVETNGGRVVVLPDRLPGMGVGRVPKLRGRHNLVFICTYAADEPWAEVIDAARLLPDDWVVYITGNFARVGLDPSGVPPNLELTGFLGEEDFVGLLEASDAILDLTTREHCLVCGAYEALSLGKVAVLSDTEALRSYFGDVAIMTRHTPEELASAMRQAVSERIQRERTLSKFRCDMELSWRERFEDLHTATVDRSS